MSLLRVEVGRGGRVQVGAMTPVWRSEGCEPGLFRFEDPIDRFRLQAVAQSAALGVACDRQHYLIAVLIADHGVGIHHRLHGEELGVGREGHDQVLEAAGEKDPQAVVRLELLLQSLLLPEIDGIRDGGGPSQVVRRDTYLIRRISEIDAKMRQELAWINVVEHRCETDALVDASFEKLLEGGFA